MRVCCGHCKSTPNTDEQMLDRLNSGHVMHPRFDRAGAQPNATDRCREYSSDEDFRTAAQRELMVKIAHS
jgi:hypothetical protein